MKIFNKRFSTSIAVRFLPSLLVTWIFVSIASSVFSQDAIFRELPYGAQNENAPTWVKMMQDSVPNLIDIEKAYKQYYRSHAFEKNEYTQYYKRWMRDKWNDIDAEGFYRPESQALKAQKLKIYQTQIAQRSQKKMSTWEEVGPWEYDHEATMSQSVQSPGAAHIWTVEQAASNADSIWAGTANAGIWCSTDFGQSWERKNAQYPFNGVYAIEINHSDPMEVYAEGGGYIWKTLDGGNSWSSSEPIQYFSWIRDIRMHPVQANILFVASVNGLYSSRDAGNSYERLVPGHFQEIEFHPTNPDIIYAVQLNGDHTRLWRSDDAGLTFSQKLNGWPGFESVKESQGFTSGDFTEMLGQAENIQLGNGPLESFTITLKIKAKDWSGDPSFLSNKNWNSGANKGWVMACNNDAWKFNIGDGANRIDLDGAFINDGQWHTIAISYDIDGLKYSYQDGRIIDTSNEILSGSTLSDLLVYFAQDGTGSYGFPFYGELADIRMYNIALSESSLQELACTDDFESHPSFSSLVHSWNFNEVTGQEIMDSAGDAHMNLSGDPQFSADNLLVCPEMNLDTGEEQRRCEIAVSAAAPDNVYVLASGSANGGSGLFGIYRSYDAGDTFEFVCCGDEPAGVASTENPNLLGWSYDFTANGGQFYYDLGLGVSPTDPERLFTAGISVARSENGGQDWETNAHWVTWVGPHTKQRYTHADVHDVKFFTHGDSVSMWVASDGGLYYSSDQGDNMEPRMYGIQGTEFWGFSSSYIADAMVGGTYHNGTLVHYKDTYPKGKYGKGGWFAGSAADETKGYNHPAYENVMYATRGMFEIVDRNQGWNYLDFDNGKSANMNGQPGRFGNYEWHPHYYERYYSPRDSVLYKTEDNGSTWDVVYDFLTGYIYRTRIPLANPSVIYTVLNDPDAVKLMKSTDAGATFQNINPSNEMAGGHNWRNKLFDINQKNPDEIYLLLTGNQSTHKIFKSTDGGQSWLDWTGDGLASENVIDISYLQGSNGGVYVGTTRAVYYRNNEMDDWALYNEGLPIISRCGYLYPYYSEGKIRLGTYTGAYECDLYEAADPVAKPSVDKYSSSCLKDTFYFKDLSYLDRREATWQWSFPGATFISDIEDPNPKVVYKQAGLYDVCLQVRDGNGKEDSICVSQMIQIEPIQDVCSNECNNVGTKGEAASSSNEANHLSPDKAIDGNLSTRWSSQYSDDQFLEVDLRAKRQICGIHIHWEVALGRDYLILASDDKVSYDTIATIVDNTSFIDTIASLDAQARYIKMQGLRRGSPYGYSIWEFEVFSNPLYEDIDGDGFNYVEDCDDNDSAINPNAQEIANNEIDENCDGDIWIIDEDGDGFNSDEDCDDTNPLINPFAEEIANNTIDEDCDGIALIIDQDGDGFNSDEDCDDTNAAAYPGSTCDDGDVCTVQDRLTESCDCVGEFKDSDEDGICNALDCKPFNANVYPGNSETSYNGLDDDCDENTLDDDLDGDGFAVLTGEDCDDTDASINPNAEEIPNNDVDENCDGEILIVDEDGDGFNSDEDCNDTDPSINPDAEEVANNEIDEDCDGETLVIDEDGDGFHSDEDCNDDDPQAFPGASCDDGDVCTVQDKLTEDCECIGLFQDSDEDGICNSLDCKPFNANVFPGNTETPYNGLDDDCDETTLDDDLDEDGFSFLSGADCDDSNPDINPDAEEIPNNSVDENCDGETLIIDDDGDGFNSDDDCDDSDPTVYPDADEICDDLDNNCNGLIDEELPFFEVFVDNDNDGFGVDSSLLEQCILLENQSLIGGDCDDSNPDINPDAEDVPNNGIDEDCDGMDLLSTAVDIKSMHFSFYPNPADEYISIECNAAMYVVELLSIESKQIKMESNARRLDIANLPPGVYFLKLTDMQSKHMAVQKLVIAK